MVRSVATVVSQVAIVGALVLIISACAKTEINYMKEWDAEQLKVIEQIPRFDQIPAYKAAAYSGSGPAANSLSTFYMKADKSGEQMLYWSLISAENGDSTGQYNVAMQYLEKKGHHYSPHRARFWLEKSANQGHVYAKKPCWV